MPALTLPNSNLLVPVDQDDGDNGHSLKEIGPDHPEYECWLPVAEFGGDPRPTEGVRE